MTARYVEKSRSWAVIDRPYRSVNREDFGHVNAFFYKPANLLNLCRGHLGRRQQTEMPLRNFDRRIYRQPSQYRHTTDCFLQHSEMARASNPIEDDAGNLHLRIKLPESLHQRRCTSRH